MKKTVLLLLCLVASLGAWAENYLPGSWNEWAADDAVKFVDGSVTIHLDAFSVYEFKLKDTGMSGTENNWKGNSGAMIPTNCTGWEFSQDANCKIVTADAGDYTFSVTWNGSTPTISVTYPTAAVAGVGKEKDGNRIVYYASHVDNDYTLIIISDRALSGMGGSYWAPSTGNERIDKGMTQPNSYTLKREVTSTTAPQMYTPFYVMIDGEVNFGQFNIDWLDGLDTRTASDLTLTSNANVALNMSTSETTSQIAYTSTSTGAVTYSSSNEAVATVSETGLITAVGGGTATITVAQAADATYKKGTATVTVNVTGEVATTWTDFMGNGGVDAKYNNLYKVGYKGDDNKPTSIANMQKPDWAAKAGIYMSFPAADITCSHECAVDGAGICLYLDQFTKDVTEVTVNYSGGSKTIYISNAAGMPAIDKEATSQASSGNAALGCDENTGTRWESAQTDDQWWCVNYGTAKSFNDIKITWEGAYGKSFNIYGSNDGETWTTLAEVRNQSLTGFPNTQVYALESTVSYKYVAFHGIARGTGYGYSFWELETYVRASDVLTTLGCTVSADICKVGQTVTLTPAPKNQYGVAMEAEVSYTVSPVGAGTFEGNVFTPSQAGLATITAHATADGASVDATALTVYCYAGDNVALNKTAVAFEGSGENDIARLTDGDDATEWQGDPVHGDNRDVTCGFVLDLGANYNLELVTIHFEGACSDAYTLETSADNVTFATAHDFSGALGINNHTDMLYGENLANNEGVRYLKFTSTKNSTQWGMKIFEFQAFGTVQNTTEAVTINPIGDASYVCTNALDFTGTGVTAYVATEETAAAIVLAEVTRVPAGTAFVVKGTAGIHDIPVATGEVTLGTTNLFVGSTTEDHTVGEAETVYAISKTYGDFRKVQAGVTIPAGKAYLVSTVSGGSAKALVFGDEMTGIINVNANESEAAVYNLSGQRVNANAKGVLIQNGKKFVNR